MQKPTEEKKILVTGGAGFIGSWLCERLIEENNNVICIDNLSTGRKQNIEHLLKNPKFQFIKHDISKPIDVKTNFIFNMASPASPVEYQKLPIETLMVNSIGTYNMLELARKNKARILIASTSEVYGDPLEHPQKEDYWGNVNPIGKRSCYDEGKRFGEALAMAFHRKYNLDVRIVRIFNTFGPRMKFNDGRALPNFIYQSLTGKPITIYGDGSQTRSFCDITDLIDGLMKMMFTDGLSGEVVNMGSTKEVSILDVAKIVKNAVGSKSQIVFKPLPEDDPIKRKPDITKAKKLLNWEPKISFDEGLKKTIKWFEKELNK